MGDALPYPLCAFIRRDDPQECRKGLSGEIHTLLAYALKDHGVFVASFFLLIEFFPSRLISLFFKDKRFILNKDDLKILTETLHSQGSIERLEKEAIVDALGFSQDRIKDVYVPLKKAVTLDYNDSFEAILAKAGESGFTRYPVFNNKQIAGYLNIFDLFYKKPDDWHEAVRPIVKIGFNQRLDDVLALLRRKKENIALVFKGKRAYGIVSTQDLIREIISALTKS